MGIRFSAAELREIADFVDDVDDMEDADENALIAYGAFQLQDRDERPVGWISLDAWKRAGFVPAADRW